MAADQDFRNWEAEEEREAKAYAKARRERQARAEAARRARSRRLARLGLAGIAALVLILVLIASIRGSVGNPVRKTLEIEAGEAMPTARDFLKNPKSKKEIVFLTDLSGVTTNHTSEIDVLTMVAGKERKSRLVIKDTVAPTAEAAPMNISAGMNVLPEDIVKNAVDATPLTFEFEEAPDVTTLGVKDVTVIVTDEGGNSIKVTTQINVINDTSAPVISGVGPLLAMTGDTVDFLNGITVEDNIDRNVEVKVDTSAVDMSKAGAYQVTYRAVDQAGNAAEVGTILPVDAKTEDYVEPEEVYKLVDEALADTIRADMTDAQKVQAIFSYVREHLWYTAPHHGDSWTASAMMGFRDKGGDAYVFAAMSRAMLTRVGIPNLPVERKNEDNDPHQWNLVDCGSGWYHYDATPRSDGTSIFMWTDAELDAYSKEHNNSHIRNTEAYPATPEEPFSMDVGNTTEE